MFVFVSMFVKEVPGGKRKRSSDGGASAGRENKKARKADHEERRDDGEWEEGDEHQRQRRSGDGGGRPKLERETREEYTVTHQQARERVCIACLRYFGRDPLRHGRALRDESIMLSDLMFFLSDLPWTADDPRVPCFLCSSCRTLVHRAATAGKESIALFLSAAPRRNQLVQKRVLARNFVCRGRQECSLCSLCVTSLFGRTSRRREPSAAPAPQP